MMVVNRGTLNCKDVLNPREVADVLRVGTTTVYRILNSGELRHIDVGRKKLIPKLYLIEYLYPEATIAEDRDGT